MPSILNSDDGVVSGTSGLKTTGGNDGILAFQNNGTERMRITAAGDVGVGTTAPVAGSRLAVVGGGTQISGGTTAQEGFRFQRISGAATITGINNDNNTFNDIALYTSGSEGARLTTAGLFQFNSGYGSSATAYGCRAWVNFNGTSNTNLSGTYSQSGTTVTVTATAHGLIAGSVIYSDITTGTAVDGTYTVATVTNANTFTYTAGTSLTTSGNITLLRNTIRGSGNVSSITDNGTGNYIVNIATAMPDINYAYTIASANFTDNNGIANVTTTSFYARTFSKASTTTQQDSDFVSVVVFR